MKTANQFVTKVFAPITWEETDDGFLRVKGRVLKECIMPYLCTEIDAPETIEDDVLQIYVSLEEMSAPEALRTLEGAQIVAPDHVWITLDNFTDSKGNTAGASRIVGPYLEIDLLVTDPETISKIRSKDIGEISAGYHADIVFEAGEFEGFPYHARQTDIRFNHIAVIPFGTGRAGEEVRILNKHTKKGDQDMSIRVQLRNSKRFVNTDEEGAAAIAAEGEAVAGEASESAKSLEKAMEQLAEKTTAMEGLQAEIDELKGELSVYKEKLDQLLSTEAVEHAAEEIVTEQGEASEILENALAGDDETKKEEVMNSIKTLRRTALHTVVLNTLGCKTEGMSAEALRGAFKAQVQLCNTKSTVARKVVGAQHLQNQVTQPVERSAHQKLGFPAEKK